MTACEPYERTVSSAFAAMLALALGLALSPVTPAAAGGNCIEIRDGYFWDPVAGDYWVPRGFAYQTINPPVFATQTPEQIEYDFLEMRKMHADSLRVDFTWGYIEQTDDVYDWTATDHIIATAEAYGLRLFVLIGYQYPPGWFDSSWMGVDESNTTSAVLNYEHPLARAAYTDFIARVTGRYKDSPAVAGWILGNEYAYFDLWGRVEPVYGTHLYIGYDTNYSLPSFRAYLTNLYAGSISALNANWGTGYAGFNDVVMPAGYPGKYDPGNPAYLNRYLPAYYDLLQWRKKSIGDFVAVGAVAAKNADTNHLCSYSMVGGIYNGMDANNTCEDAKTIVNRCAAAGAPLDFWSINNYAWASQGNELRTAQYGITKYQDQSGLPVLVTETGHSSTETLFPGTFQGQAEPLPGQVWEALMAGAAGVQVFTWNDRPFWGDQYREYGFGIVRTNRLIKKPVYWNILETFRRMEQVDVSRLFGGTESPASDIYFYWSSDADMVWPRANQENCMLWGGLKRLGYEPGFIDEDAFDAGTYTNVRALLLSHAFMMQSNRVIALTNVIAAGVNLHANATLPGRYDPYHKENPRWAALMSEAFGLNVTNSSGATNYWHGGISGNWEQPYSKITAQYLTTLGALNPSYTFTNYASWVRQDGILVNSGTTVVTVAYDYYAWRTVPGLHIKGHPQAKAAVNTWPLGDTLKMWWLTNAPPAPELPIEIAWQLHYDWGRAIYRTWFGMGPAVDLSGAGYFYVVPDYRICTNGNVLISLLNESSNAVTVTMTASNLVLGHTIERLSSPGGVLETNSDGQVGLTLAGDEYVLLYAYTNNESLINTSPYKIWVASEPPGIWPNGGTHAVSVGYDTRGATLDLYLALERSDGPHIEYARTNLLNVSGIGSNSLDLCVPDADLGDTNYVSSHDGADYVLHAWLQDGAVTAGECRLGTRLLWGARPDAVPVSTETGQTYDITVNWQELPSYEPAEYPTPLSRADVWQASRSNAEQYTVFLDLMTGTVAVASSNVVMSSGTGSNTFSFTVPGGLAGPFGWRARTVSGGLAGSSNNHDVVDGFEGRAWGGGAASLLPWVNFGYAQNNNYEVYTQGVHGIAWEGTNSAFVACGFFSPAGWAGFGMYYDYPEAWTLPPADQYTNIRFSFAFLETNNYTGTLEMKLEDSGSGALSYTLPYSGGGWSNISATLDEFSGSIDTADVSRLVVLLQADGRDVTYLGCFDAIVFTGTPWEVTGGGGDGGSGDLRSSFEGLSQGDWVNPDPWTLYSYGDGTESYVKHGIDDIASDGTNGCFAIYNSHTNVGGWSGFFLIYAFPESPLLPADLSEALFEADFRETNGHSGVLELQIKSASGLSKYTEPYSHSPGGWDTISATLDQFTGDADTDALTEIVVLCQMSDREVQYAGHFDNISFTGTLASATAPVTNGLYLSINDTPSGGDSDGDGILDIYETNTGTYNGPTDTGTDPTKADTDGDGLNDGDEVIAGTDPTEAGSCFSAEDLRQDPSGMLIEWFARTGRVYAVHYLDGSLVTDLHLFAPLNGWTNITVSANGYTNVVDTAAAVTTRFYRIVVRGAE